MRERNDPAGQADLGGASVPVERQRSRLEVLDDLCGKLLTSCRSHLLRLVRQHRQRRLQAMRRIAGLCRSACNTPFTVFEVMFPLAS